MILADTSVWVDHFRKHNPVLLDLVEGERLLIHPFVIGELSLGNLSPRHEVLADLRHLRYAAEASDGEVADLIERETLFSQGIGYVDAHLLASTLISAGCALWTRDKRLMTIADRLGVVADVG